MLDHKHTTMADELELCFSSSSSNSLKKNTIFGLIACIILHDLSLLCSFIISYPLYFSYFIFFSPYLIKLVSFISPQFVATIILSLLLTTTTAFCPTLPQLELGILQTVIQELKSNLDEDHADEKDLNFEDFEIYKIVFDRTLLITICNEGDEEVPLSKKIPENSVHDETINDSGGDNLEEEKCLEKLFEELDRFEDFTTAVETNADSNKVIEELRKAEAAPVKNVGGGSVAESVAITSSDDDKVSQNSVRSSSWRSNSSSILSSHGSMREEKEWRRTLACKLFEERHNSRGGEEGMDSLWEAYENDYSKNRKETMINDSKSMMMVKKNSNNGSFKSFNDDDEDEDEDEDEDDDEEMSNGHLCCLQALKLSTGKMNLGMRKPNLVKISKALKGFGWLHHVKNKHGKKS